MARLGAEVNACGGTPTKRASALSLCCVGSSPAKKQFSMIHPAKAHDWPTPSGSSAPFEGLSLPPSQTANDEAPPMAIGVNPRRAGRDAYLVELRDAGIPASPAPHAEAGAGEPDGHHGAVVCNVDRTVSA
jgi:hypothetical protein